MLSNKIIASLLASAAIVSAALALPSIVSAGRSMSALAGGGTTPAYADCLNVSPNTATVYNACAVDATYAVSIPIDGSGNKAVTVNVRQGVAGDVDCLLTSTYSNGGSYASGGWKPLAVVGSSTDLSLGSVYVPGAGTLYVTCKLGPTGRVNTVRY